jgi:beta-aspartyl-peptidase (threonine type)
VSTQPAKIQPILLVHGGAWAIPDDMVERHLIGIRAALSAGWNVLALGGGALDAIEEAVAVMEDDDIFDAGRGSFLTSDGRVQLDALMMDGATLRAGGVGCVERIRNPIRAARKVLDDSPHIYLVAEGAERFAEQHGVALCDNSELVIERERKRLAEARKKAAAGEPIQTFRAASSAPPARRAASSARSKKAAREEALGSHDTVGAVALDSRGNLAAATSTGGTLNKTPGRVGDSSLIGCGCYADNQSAAVSCTGWGEPIMKLVLGKWACDQVGRGEPPQTVAIRALDYMKSRLDGHGGIILLNVQGKAGIFHNTPRMAWGLKSATAEEVAISRGR